MEPIESYLTREGWSNDLNKTVERHPSICGFFKEGHWQALVPGWNLFYMTKEYLGGMKQIEEQFESHVLTRTQLKKDLLQVKEYVRKRDIADSMGDSETTKRLNQKIYFLAKSNINLTFNQK